MLIEWGCSLVISEMEQESQKHEILQENVERSHI